MSMLQIKDSSTVKSFEIKQHKNPHKNIPDI